MKLTTKQLKDFLAQPGINKNGIAKEAGMFSMQLYRFEMGIHELTEEVIERLLPIMTKYGYKPDLSFEGGWQNIDTKTI